VKLCRDLNELPESPQPGAITIGNFDGVHCGHVRIVERLIEKAAQLGGPSVVFTFDPHPVRLLRPDKAPPPLTWPERKAELLGRLGVDVVVVYPTDKKLLSLSPREFFEMVVIGRLRARAVVEGENFFFGRDRSGNVESLARLCHENSVSLDIVPPVREGDTVVSSSFIRSCILAGRIEVANRLLFQPYRIRGQVTRGAGRGTTIGFPTANLHRIDSLVPGAGVYAGRAFVGGHVFDAAINVGPNPTFGETEAKVELHLLDFSMAIYDQILEVEFKSRMRDVRQFASAAELIEQLVQDVQAVRRGTRAGVLGQ
jgi:riboflavin kinase/FMN adenylyltransferase